MRQSIKFIVVIMIALLSFMVTSAQDENQTITYDEVVSGEINGQSYEYIYTFEGEAGDTIVIEMLATDDDPQLDSYLYLQDADGNELASDDDGAGNLNSRIGPYTLADSGVYRIVATRFQEENGSSEGSFELSIALASFEEVAIGDKVRVTFEDASSTYTYELTAESDGVYEVQFRLISGVGSADLSIRDADGNYVTNVTAADYYESGFGTFKLGADETVSITLSYYDYGSYDDEDAELAETVEVGFSIEVVESEAIDIPEGESLTVVGTLEDESSVDYYTFSAISNQMLTIDGEASNDGNFEVYVVMPSGYESFYGSSYYIEDDLLVMPEIVDETGEFILVVYRSDYYDEEEDNAPVEYELNLILEAVAELESGVAVEGSFENDGDYYAQDPYLYVGEEGEVLTVTINNVGDHYASSFSIELSSEDIPEDDYNGFYVNFGSSHAGSFSYTFSLPYSGTYIFRVYNGSYQDSGEIGQYELLIESS